MRQNAFKELKLLQYQHKKVKHIPFVGLGNLQKSLKQKYLVTKCQTVKNTRNNFHKYYNNDIWCKLGCTQKVDSQEHMLSCHRLISKSGIRTIKNLSSFD